MSSAAPAPVRRADPARALRRILAEACATLAAGSAAPPWRALLLTGSLARGESLWEPVASRQRAGAGQAPGPAHSQRWRLLGDVDLIAIVQDPSEVRVRLPPLRQALTTALSRAGLQAEMSLSAGGAGYLERLPPSIFSFELQTTGEVLWGERKILRRIPRCTANHIPREDAWRLLNNRIVELIAALAEGPGPSAALAGEKLDLDMAASWLLFTGGYALEAATRLRRVERLWEGAAITSPWPLDSQWLARLRRATARRTGLCGAEAEPEAMPAPTPAGMDDRQVRQTRADALALWRWELAQMGHADLAHCARSAPAHPGRVAWLAAAHAARGWAARARCLGLALGWRPTSPRYRVYAAATEWLWGYPQLTPAAVQAAGRLPVTPPPGGDREQVAAAVGANYQRWVAPTRR